MTHVMWVDADDDHVLINTEVHRAKFKAVERDPRVTVMIWDKDDPYTLRRGARRVVETVRRPGGAGAHRRAVAEVPRRDYDPGNIHSERVILRIAPDVQHAASAGAPVRNVLCSPASRTAVAAAAGSELCSSGLSRVGARLVRLRRATVDRCPFVRSCRRGRPRGQLR